MGESTAVFSAHEAENGDSCCDPDDVGLGGLYGEVSSAVKEKSKNSFCAESLMGSSQTEWCGASSVNALSKYPTSVSWVCVPSQYGCMVECV